MTRLLLTTLCVSLAGAVQADSLFSMADARGGTLIAQKPARFEVGDIITVLVRESIDATTTADTNTKKESDVSANANPNQNQFFIAQDPGLNILNAEELPNWGVDVENETKARGRTVRKSTLTTTIACVVTQVLPNDNIMIEGEKRISMNREDSVIVVTGMVRAKDVSPANTIPSTQVAGAQVLLKGKGPLWNNQRRGIFTRILDWFAPY
jgi:flagellar L-ring protein precursor FlgH